MQAEIIFKNEERQGLGAVGSYLSDVARRFGLRPEFKCDPLNSEHCCAVRIERGEEILSARTDVETEYLKTVKNSANTRLMCQARIEKVGEVVIMTNKKKSQPPEDAAKPDLNDEYIKAFGEMPLEKKIANLVNLEAMALGETLTYVINSPFTIFEKIVDVMAEFGFRKESEKKSAARPKEHGKAKKTKPPAKRTARVRKTGKPKPA